MKNWEEIALFRVEVRSCQFFNCSFCTADLSCEELIVATIDSSWRKRDVCCWMRVDLTIPVGVHPDHVMTPVWWYFYCSFILDHRSSSWHSWEIDSRYEMISFVLWFPIRKIVMGIMFKIVDFGVNWINFWEIFNLHFPDRIEENSNFLVNSFFILSSCWAMIFLICLNDIWTNRNVCWPCLLDQWWKLDFDLLPWKIVE